MYDFRLDQKQVSVGDNPNAPSLNHESAVVSNQNLSNGDLVTADSTTVKRRFKMPKISHGWTKELAFFGIPAVIMLSIALGYTASPVLLEKAILEKAHTVASSTYADAVILEAEGSSDASDLLALEKSINGETKSVAVVISGSGESLKVEGGLDLDNDNVIDKDSEIVTIGSVIK